MALSRTLFLCLLLWVNICTVSASFSGPASGPENNHEVPSAMNYKLSSSFKVISTSEAGDRLAIKENIPFQDGSPEGIRVVIKPDILKQKLQGIGSSFTESSAFVLAHLSTEKRQELMRKIYGQADDGAGFTLTRTPIGSCDFCVEGKYCYQTDEEDDFSINPDSDGFKDKTAYPRIQDRNYDLLPMIQEALQINPEIRIIEDCRPFLDLFG